MIRSFQVFQQFFHFFKGRQTQIQRFDAEWFAGGLLGGCQAEPKKAIHDLLQRFAGAADFFVEQARYIIIESESGSHILILRVRHHDVNCIAS